MPVFNSESLSIFNIKEFRFFFYARFFLTLAIQMQMSTISLQVYYEHTREEFVLGLIGLAEAVPFIISSFFSGHVADTVNRRKVLLGGIFALFLGTVLLFFYSSPLTSFLKTLGMTALFGVVFLFGIIRSFLASTTHPFMSQIVPRSQYTNSATWNSTAWHVGAILGPVVAGLIYGYHNSLNADVCYAVNGVLYLLSFVFILRISSKPMPPREQNETLYESMTTV